MRRLALFASISAMFLALLPLGSAQAVSDAAAGAIPGSYIVVLNDGEPGAVAAEHSRRHNSSVTHVYRHALRGYAARMSEQAAANVARDRRVAYVEQDGVATTAEVGSWGLDRIDQRDLPLDSTFAPDGAGFGVRAYVLDTGIRASHEEFEGRVDSGFDAIKDGRGTDDCQGHGTHVAGTIGGVTYGVAKQVMLVPVRVLNCRGSGSWSGVISGIDWVAGDAAGRPAVANMSLTGGYSDSVNNAVANSIDRGVVYALAAGNNTADACKYSPASTPAALTVGATTSTDVQASYSNFGTCVDLLAPGSSITSANYTGGSSTKSGTSMAAPHVAGVAALLRGKGVSPTDASAAIVGDATVGTLTVQGAGTPNLLLYTAPVAGNPPPPGNTPPTASFTYTCTGLTCTFTDASSDTDGSIASRAWAFGDGGTSSDTNPSHSYAAGGSYTVTLTVTDNGGATGTQTQSVPVTAPSGGGVSVTVTGSKVKGVQHASVDWAGAESVDITRDGGLVATATQVDPYPDNIGVKGGGSYTYKVCATGSVTNCAEATVTF